MAFDNAGLVVAPTLGDQSEVATSGDREIISCEFIETSSPQDYKPGIVGDQAVNLGTTSSLFVTGSAEEVIARRENVDAAYQTYRLSSIQEPIVDAISANVYGAGHTFRPVIDPDSPGAAELVRGYLAYGRAYTGGVADFDADTTVNDTDVDAELDRLRRRLANERVFLDAFFKNACAGSSYHMVSLLTGQDLEIVGQAYWEILRGLDGRPQRIIWTPAWSVMAKPLSQQLYAVLEDQQITPILWGRGQQYRRFRSYVQVDGAGNVIGRYKEYGDPRCLSRKTGRFYDTIDDMHANPDEFSENPVYGGSPIPAQPATELLTFTMPCSASFTYGKPKSTGIYPSLKGGRDLDEENMAVVTGQTVPQLFILVSGGKGIPKDDIARLEKAIVQNRKEGKKGIFILHARSEKGMAGQISAAPNVKIEKTKSEQHDDALGLKYQEYNYQSVRRAYRLPRVALGDEEGINHDTALTMRRLAENEVYDPRRDLIDDRINSTLLPDLGIRASRYKTLSRAPKEPTELAEIIKSLSGILTPDESRALISDIFNRDFKDLESAWSRLPPQVLTALLQTKNQLVAAAVLGDEKGMMARINDALADSLQGVADPTVVEEE